MSENEERLQIVYKAGALPFAQLEQPIEWREYSKAWKQFQRMWARPVIYKAHMKEICA